MKHLLIMFFAFFALGTVSAVNSGNSPIANEVSVTKKEEKAAKKLEKFEKKIDKIKEMISKKDDNFTLVLALLLLFFLGGLAIHRIYLGGKPLLILGYLGLTITIIGAPLVFAMLIGDLIKIVSDIDHMKNNSKLFAGFGAK